ncbi:MAG: hypothetical protein OEX22_08325 [Cyclobacteriaceae bacterium]|nr:hypothetical protein [Cyclobacteriaceae bacterium]
MKTALIILTLSLIPFISLQAQKVNVTEKKNRVGDELYIGYSSKIAGDEDAIESQWYKALRGLGRLREEGNHLVVKEADLEVIGEKLVPVFSKLTPSDTLTEIWITGNKTLISGDSLDLVNTKLQLFLYNFSLTFYKNKAQEKIDEADRAVAFTAKKLNKLKADSVELAKDLRDNIREIERLKELIEKNELEEKVIAQKIIDNKLYYDSTFVDLERLKKVVEKKKKIKAAIE